MYNLYFYSTHSITDLKELLKQAGYSGANSIEIESSNINNVSKWIDSAKAGGANNVNNVRLHYQKKHSVRTKTDVAVRK